MPQICQRLGIPGYALNRDLLNPETGLQWTADKLHQIAEQMGDHLGNDIERIDIGINRAILEAFGKIPPLGLKTDFNQTGVDLITIVAPDAIPCTTLVHLFACNYDERTAGDHASKMRGDFHDLSLGEEAMVMADEEFIATELKLRLQRIAAMLVKKPSLFIDESDAETREDHRLATAIRKWHADLINASRGEIRLDRSALRIGRLVRLTNERWKGKSTTSNPLIDVDLLTMRFDAIEQEDSETLHLDAIEALKLISKARNVELVSEPTCATGKEDTIPPLILSERRGEPLITTADPFVYQTTTLIIVAEQIPEILLSQASGKPLEQLYTSVFTDGLGITVEGSAEKSYGHEDWHNHYLCQVILNEILVSSNLPAVEFENHIDTGAMAANHISDGHPIAASTSIAINRSNPLTFKISGDDADNILSLS